MKRLPTDRFIPHLAALKSRLHSTQVKPMVYPLASINDDLSDYTEIDIDQEIISIQKRLDKKIYLPEGENGLIYRLHRLQAQAKKVMKQRTGKGTV